MADQPSARVKISQLPLATLPLSGTEYMVIVQDGVTKRAPVPTYVPSGPVNTVAPLVTGTTTQGQTLSVTTGTWTGSPTSYAYQWKRNAMNIGGATASTYLLVLADVGTIISCTVTATKDGLSASATSAGTAPIEGVGPTLLPLNTRLIFVGDSNTARDFSPFGYAELVRVSTEGRYYMPPNGNRAVAGTNATDHGVDDIPNVVNLIDEAMTSGSEAVVVGMYGTNGGTLGAWLTCIDAYKAAGAVVVILGVPPKANDMAYDNGFNSTLSAYPGITYIDTHALITNSVNDFGAGDNVHFSAASGHPKLATAVAAVLNGLTTTDTLYTLPEEAAAVSLDMSGTGGSVSTGITGSLANGWNASRGFGDGTMVCSKPNATTQRFDLSGGASGGFFFLSGPDAAVTVLTGEVWETTALVKAEGSGLIDCISMYSSVGEDAYDIFEGSFGKSPSIDYIAGTHVWRVDGLAGSNASSIAMKMLIGVKAGQTFAFEISKGRHRRRKAA